MSKNRISRGIKLKRIGWPHEKHTIPSQDLHAVFTILGVVHEFVK